MWPLRLLSRFSHVQLFATLRTVAHQAPLSMGLSQQEFCSGLPRPLPGDLPDPGIESISLMSPALADRFFTTGATWDALADCLISLDPNSFTSEWRYIGTFL